MEKNSVLAAMALIYAALISENEFLRFKMIIFQKGLIQILSEKNLVQNFFGHVSSDGLSFSPDFLC